MGYRTAGSKDHLRIETIPHDAGSYGTAADRYSEAGEGGFVYSTDRVVSVLGLVRGSAASSGFPIRLCAQNTLKFEGLWTMLPLSQFEGGLGFAFGSSTLGSTLWIGTYDTSWINVIVGGV